MSEFDNNSDQIDLKIDILLSNQYSWILEKMCRTSMRGFFALKEFLQNIKNCSNTRDYLDHYLNITKDVEFDMNLWKSQYDLLNNGKTFPNYTFDYERKTTNSSSETHHLKYDDNIIIQQFSSDYLLDEFKDNYPELLLKLSNEDDFQADHLQTYIDEYKNSDSINYQSMKQKKQKFKNSKNAKSASDKKIWYKCGWNGCSFGSFYNGVVKRHNEQIHKGETKISISSETRTHRFKCDWPECNVSLVAYHKLVEHKRIHTGEKPFKCKINGCNYATARLYSMISHYKSHRQQ